MSSTTTTTAPAASSNKNKDAAASLSKEQQQLPYLCQFWQQFHRTCGVNVIPVSMLTFLVLNMGMHQFLISPSYMSWPDGIETSRAASFFVGFFHTASIVPALLQWFHWSGYEANAWAPFRSTAERDALVPIFRFANAYFIYDSLYNLLYLRYWVYGAMKPNEWLFLLHHVVCSACFTWAAVMNEGHQFIASLQLFAEVSNPFDNIVSFTRQGLLLSPGPFLLAINGQARVILCLLYFVFRGILAPFWLLPVLTAGFWKDGRGGDRRWMSIFRMCASWGIELGSIPWVIHCAKFLWRYCFEGESAAAAAEL